MTYLEIRTRRRDRKRKAGTKTVWAMKGKKREREGEKKMRSVFIHSVSTNYPCIYSVLLGIRIVLENNSANE